MQTLNTASPGTALSLGDNILTGDVGIAASQTTGALEIGTFSTRSGQITIGGEASTSPVRIDAGSGGIRLQSTGALRINASKYIFGNKGSVTQLISQTTPVTINTPLGKITTVTLNIPNNSISEFTVNNDIIDIDSIVFLTIDQYTGNSIISVTANNIRSGAFDIEIENAGPGTLDQPCTIAYMAV